MYNRELMLPDPPKRTFFLWGPRQTGKSTLLKRAYPQAYRIDLLKSDEYIAYTTRPSLLRERLAEKKDRFIIIDEVQKVPALLDEVHYLIENEKLTFALCGSSARKLKKSHANLLGGRAIRYELHGLVSSEIGPDFDLTQLLNHGYIPSIYDAGSDSASLQKSYCADYLKEEIFSEGLVRGLSPFSRFLELAALSDTELLSFETFARDCGVSPPTIRSYFDILSDTLIGSYLPGYRLRPKRKTVASPKFYFSDVGVVNHLAQRGEIKTGSELFGKAFENWVYHELKAYLSYRQRAETLSYWKLTTQVEVDFIIGHMKSAIEAKASKKIHSDHLKGLKELKKDYPEVKNRYVVSLEPESRVVDKDIHILSVSDFCKKLWADKLI